MKDKKKKQKKDAEPGKKKNRAVIIFISVFVGLVMILGAVIGIISAVRYANAVVSFNGTYMDKEVAAFFVSLYKIDYRAEVIHEGYNPDAKGFWESERIPGVSFAEDFSARAKNYLKETLIASYIFDSYRALTDAEVDKIDKVCSDVLSFKAGGDEDTFNEMAEKHGFDYDSFCDAVTIYYKSSLAFDAMYGEEGYALKSDEVVCGSYLEEYTHVSLLILRTETKLQNGDNDWLNETQKKEQAELIDKVHAAMVAYENDDDGKMTTEAFTNWLSQNTDSGDEWKSTGYYFHPDAKATKEFAKEIPGVVELAYRMEMYTFAEIEVTVNIPVDDKNHEELVHIFIYKHPVKERAYENESLLEYWLSDFFKDAAEYLYASTLNSYMDKVDDGGFADEFDYVSIAHNVEFVPNFEGIEE